MHLRKQAKIKLNNPYKEYKVGNLRFRQVNRLMQIILIK